MKKRTLAMLLALVLVISIVPMAAMAKECEHKGGNLPNAKFDGTHDVWCLSCNTWYIKGQKCSYTDGKCTVCAAPCDHKEALKACTDGKHHEVVCRVCNTILRTEDCTFGKDGKCICGNGAAAEKPTAPACKHTPKAGTYVRNATGGHDVKCAKCGETYHEACTFSDGKCVCGAANPDACTHKEALKACADGKHHEVVCRVCNTILRTENCTFGKDGKCICGNGAASEKPVAPACKHTPKAGTYERNATGGHDVKCAKCGETYHEACTFSDGKCVCGAANPDACTHKEALKACADGKHHEVVCRVCNTILRTENCTFGKDGKCICGNGAASEKPVAPACKHTPKAGTYERNATGGHDVECAKCGELYHEDCTFVDGKCVCGATNSDYVAPEAPACKHPKTDEFFKSIDDTHHKVICLNCGETTLASEACEFVDGVCACGNVQEDDTCHHTGNNWDYEDNGNGTHKVICKDCGKVESENAECVYTNGVCRACGSKEPEQKPATDKDLDNVPKTGDNGSVIVITSMTVLSVIAGAAFVFNKKRAF